MLYHINDDDESVGDCYVPSLPAVLVSSGYSVMNFCVRTISLVKCYLCVSMKSEIAVCGEWMPARSVQRTRASPRSVWSSSQGRSGLFHAPDMEVGEGRKTKDNPVQAKTVCLLRPCITSA